MPDFTTEAATKATRRRPLTQLALLVRPAAASVSEGPWLCRIASLDRAQLPPKARAQVSGNIAGLCTWTRAMCTYFELAKVVEPKRIAVAIAEARQARNLFECPRACAKT